MKLGDGVAFSGYAIPRKFLLLSVIHLPLFPGHTPRFSVPMFTQLSRIYPFLELTRKSMGTFYITLSPPYRIVAVLANSFLSNKKEVAFLLLIVPMVQERLGVVLFYYCVTSPGVKRTSIKYYLL